MQTWEALVHELPAEITQLVEEKQLEISHEDRITWITSLWAETNGLHLLMKLLAGGAGVWVAVAMAGPASTKVQI